MTILPGQMWRRRGLAPQPIAEVRRLGETVVVCRFRHESGSSVRQGPIPREKLLAEYELVDSKVIVPYERTESAESKRSGAWKRLT